MIDQDTRAAKSFYRAVRKFSVSAKPWETDAIFYETKPDEEYDPTLISKRAYGRRDEFLAVMAAAGIDQVDQPIRQKRIALPSEGRLYRMKRQTGFESIADYRENGAPVWGG
jgi:hypothetical protein